jgi:hypothetical protein
MNTDKARQQSENDDEDENDFVIVRELRWSTSVGGYGIDHGAKCSKAAEEQDIGAINEE